MALAYMLRPEYAITIDYGHCAAEAEVKSASMFCSEVNLTHEVIRIDCSEIGLGIMMRAEKVGQCASNSRCPTIARVVAVSEPTLDHDRCSTGCSSRHRGTLRRCGDI